MIAWRIAARARVTSMVFAACLLGGACSDKPASGDIGAAVALTSPAPTGSSTPSLVLAANGAALLSWTERGADSSVAIRMASFHNGEWDSTRTISSARSYFVNWADFPSMSALANGDIAAHWLEREASGKYAYGVRVVRSTDGGVTWSAPVTPHTDGLPAEHGFVALWPSGADGLGLAWLDGRKGAMKDSAREMTLRSAVVAPNGSLREETVLDARTCDCCQVASARAASGQVVVYRDRSHDEIRDIMVVRQVGGVWSEPKPVHADNWHIEGCPVNGPQVVARGDTVAVTWFTGANDTTRVLFAQSVNGGATFGAPVRIDDGNPLGRVALAFDREGHALVGWMERKTPETAEVRVRRITDGAASPGQTVATTSSARQSGFPRMVVTGDTLLIAWTETSPSMQVRVAQLPLSNK